MVTYGTIQKRNKRESLAKILTNFAVCYQTAFSKWWRRIQLLPVKKTLLCSFIPHCLISGGAECSYFNLKMKINCTRLFPVIDNYGWRRERLHQLVELCPSGHVYCFRLFPHLNKRRLYEIKFPH